MKNGEKFEKFIDEKWGCERFACSVRMAMSIATGKPNCITDGTVIGCKKCLNESLEWLNAEYKEPILTDEEKDIVKSMCDFIHKFGCEVICVSKFHDEFGNYCIFIKYKNKLALYNEKMATPWFKNDKFKGMIPDKEYTLEELGITCQTQKDN